MAPVTFRVPPVTARRASKALLVRSMSAGEEDALGAVADRFAADSRRVDEFVFGHVPRHDQMGPFADPQVVSTDDSPLGKSVNLVKHR